MSSENIKTAVQEKYGAAAKRAASRQGTACCGTSPASAIEGCDPITSNLYGEGEAGSVPEAALRASLGCGNPTALAKLELGKQSWILGPVAASTFYSQHAALVQLARRTGLI